MEFVKDEIPLYRGIKFSDHQIAFQEVLGLTKVRNKQSVCRENGVCWKNNFYDIFVMIFVILF